MSPFQAESLLTEFLLAQGNFAEEAPSELLRLSQDGRNSAKERGARSTPPPKPGWVNPGQILQWVEDRSPQDPRSRVLGSGPLRPQTDSPGPES